jgi:hypothetical protein
LIATYCFAAKESNPEGITTSSGRGGGSSPFFSSFFSCPKPLTANEEHASNVTKNCLANLVDFNRIMTLGKEYWITKQAPPSLPPADQCPGNQTANQAVDLSQFTRSSYSLPMIISPLNPIDEQPEQRTP